MTRINIIYGDAGLLTTDGDLFIDWVGGTFVFTEEGERLMEEIVMKLCGALESELE